MYVCIAPCLLDLPPSVFGSVCLSLDSGVVHNWRALVQHLNDYTIMDVRQLSIIEQRVSNTFLSKVAINTATNGRVCGTLLELAAINADMSECKSSIYYGLSFESVYRYGLEMCNFVYMH